MTRDAEHTPSPQSVVVPGSAWERFLYRSDFLRGAAVVDGHDVSLRSFASLVEELKAAAAPAPLSLAGGEVRASVARLSNDASRAVEFGATNATVRVDDLRAILAALSPEAPARDGGDVPRDEKGRTAFEIIADCNRESMMRRAGVKDQSREPLLGPPSDMAVSRILLAERPEIDRHAADLLAIKINDALSALTPRHEAPAEGAGELDDDDATTYAPSIAGLSDYLWNQALADESVEGRCILEGWREAVDALRARSSAPEAREEALGNLLAVIHGDGGHRALEVGTKQAALEAEKIVAGLMAAPSADKLRIAVEALEVAKRLAMTHAPLSAAPKIIKALAALKAEV